MTKYYVMNYSKIVGPRTINFCYLAEVDGSHMRPLVFYNKYEFNGTKEDITKEDTNVKTIDSRGRDLNVPTMKDAIALFVLMFKTY